MKNWKALSFPPPKNSGLLLYSNESVMYSNSNMVGFPNGNVD